MEHFGPAGRGRIRDICGCDSPEFDYVLVTLTHLIQLAKPAAFPALMMDFFFLLSLAADSTFRMVSYIVCFFMLMGSSSGAPMRVAS
jgi:hypothetical protein